MHRLSINEKWIEVCNKVASYPEVDNSQFNALLERVQPQAMSEGFLLLSTETSFLKVWAEKNFQQYIVRALNEIYGVPFFVSFEIDESGSNTNNQPVTVNVNTEKINPPQLEHTHLATLNNENKTVAQNTFNANTPTLKTPEKADNNNIDINQVEIDDDINSYTFENFVIGDSNRLAYSMAVQVAEEPGQTALNPLFIYGKSGLGKTHLLRAIQNYINRTFPSLTTVYTDAEGLVSGYTDAVTESTQEKYSYKTFKTRYENADILLIDDVQFLQGKKQTLDIVFQIFNNLIKQGKQIVLSADRAPKNIDIDERYSSRFMQGGTIDIQPPELETKLGIIRCFVNEYKSMNADSNGLPEEFQNFIAENSGSNIRELKGAVRMILFRTSHDEELNIANVRQILDNYFSGGMSKNLTIDDIQKEVENYYKIKHSDMIGKSRERSVVYPRQIAMYMCRQLLDVPHGSIGKKFNRDHSTVMHAVTKIEDMMIENRDVQEEVESLKQIIKEL
jgi:chromosomal replication initiator protein